MTLTTAERTTQDLINSIDYSAFNDAHNRMMITFDVLDRLKATYPNADTIKVLTADGCFIEYKK